MCLTLLPELNPGRPNNFFKGFPLSTTDSPCCLTMRPVHCGLLQFIDRMVGGEQEDRKRGGGSRRRMLARYMGKGVSRSRDGIGISRLRRD